MLKSRTYFPSSVQGKIIDPNDLKIIFSIAIKPSAIKKILVHKHIQSGNERPHDKSLNYPKASKSIIHHIPFISTYKRICTI